MAYDKNVIGIVSLFKHHKYCSCFEPMFLHNRSLITLEKKRLITFSAPSTSSLSDGISVNAKLYNGNTNRMARKSRQFGKSPIVACHVFCRGACALDECFISNTWSAVVLPRAQERHLINKKILRVFFTSNVVFRTSCLCTVIFSYRPDGSSFAERTTDGLAPDPCCYSDAR